VAPFSAYGNLPKLLSSSSSVLFSADRLGISFSLPHTGIEQSENGNFCMLQIKIRRQQSDHEFALAVLAGVTQPSPGEQLNETIVNNALARLII
jgi:hypothetical protein